MQPRRMKKKETKFASSAKCSGKDKLPVKAKAAKGKKAVEREFASGEDDGENSETAVSIQTTPLTKSYSSTPSLKKGRRHSRLDLACPDDVFWEMTYGR